MLVIYMPEETSNILNHSGNKKYSLKLFTLFTRTRPTGTRIISNIMELLPRAVLLRKKPGFSLQCKKQIYMFIHKYISPRFLLVLLLTSLPLLSHCTWLFRTHSGDLQHIQWTRVCGWKPDRSPLVKIARLTVKFQSG